jgi:L-fuconolactonase
MLLDAHQHFWKYNPIEYSWINDQMDMLKRDFLPEDLLSELKPLGFDGSIAVQARQSMEETRWLLKLADEYDYIKGVVGWVNLCSPDVEKQLSEFMHNRKLVGIRHVVHDEPADEFMRRKDFQYYLDVIFDCFGTNRLMIGSDWPVCTLAGEYKQVMSLIIDYLKQFSPDAQTKILGENCYRVYKIQQ